MTQTLPPAGTAKRARNLLPFINAAARRTVVAAPLLRSAALLVALASLFVRPSVSVAASAVAMAVAVIAYLPLYSAARRAPERARASAKRSVVLDTAFAVFAAAALFCVSGFEPLVAPLPLGLAVATWWSKHRGPITPGVPKDGRQAGTHARALQTTSLKNGLTAASVATAALLILAWLALGGLSLPTKVLLGCAVVTLLVGAGAVLTYLEWIYGYGGRRVGAVKQRIGAEAEEMVAATLTPLDRFWMLPNADLGRGDLDILVACPNGLFALEVKAGGSGMPRNAPQTLEKAVPQIIDQRQRLLDLTGYDAAPIVVYADMSESHLTLRRQGVDVAVCGKAELVQFISGIPGHLSRHSADEVLRSLKSARGSN